MQDPDTMGIYLEEIAGAAMDTIRAQSHANVLAQRAAANITREATAAMERQLMFDMRTSEIARIESKVKALQNKAAQATSDIMREAYETQIELFKAEQLQLLGTMRGVTKQVQALPSEKVLAIAQEDKPEPKKKSKK